MMPSAVYRLSRNSGVGKSFETLSEAIEAANEAVRGSEQQSVTVFKEVARVSKGPVPILTDILEY